MSIDIALVIAGQSATVLHDALLLSYAAPVVSALTLSPVIGDNTMDCSSIGPDGRPVSSVGSAIVLIDGANFGGNQSEVFVQIGRDDCNILTSTESRIVCSARSCTGEHCYQRIQVPSRDSRGHGPGCEMTLRRLCCGR